MRRRRLEAYQWQRNSNRTIFFTKSQLNNKPFGANQVVEVESALPPYVSGIPTVRNHKPA
jgi:hypothetical protein